MKIKTSSLAFAALLLAGAADPAAAAPDALDRRVSLDLQDATAAEAFRSLAQVTGVRVDLQGLTDEKVSLELENVRVRTLLTALCESLGCRWELTDGTPPQLKIVARPGARPPARVKPSLAALDAEIDLRVKGANVRDVLETVGQITSTRAFVDSAVQGQVTLELEKTSIRQILDTLCQTAKCTWSFDPDKGILAVRPKG